MKDAYAVFERDGCLKDSQVQQALDFFKVALHRQCADKGDEHPAYVDAALVKFELDEVAARKIREKRRDGRFSSDEWESCFRAVWDAKEKRRRALEDVHPPVRKHVKRRRPARDEDELVSPPCLERLSCDLARVCKGVHTLKSEVSHSRETSREWGQRELVARRRLSKGRDRVSRMFLATEFEIARNTPKKGEVIVDPHVLSLIHI